VLDCFENINEIWIPLTTRYFFIGWAAVSLSRRPMFHGVSWYSV